MGSQLLQESLAAHSFISLCLHTAPDNDLIIEHLSVVLHILAVNARLRWLSLEHLLLARGPQILSRKLFALQHLEPIRVQALLDCRRGLQTVSHARHLGSLLQSAS
jgi:hypothetical protein